MHRNMSTTEESNITTHRNISAVRIVQRYGYFLKAPANGRAGTTIRCICIQACHKFYLSVHGDVASCVSFDGKGLFITVLGKSLALQSLREKERSPPHKTFKGKMH